MNTRILFSVGLSALALTGTLASQGYAAGDARAAKHAATDAKRAGKALDRRDGATAVRFAEEAVAFAPRAAGYRLLLGQSYLQAGRFASAAAAFGDALALDPGNGRAALNLSLAQIATGNWQGARDTLVRHADNIPAADRGLALALAGDPAGAVGLLMEAARLPGADAKVRQNLALSFALAGQWQAARATASADMSPADVDERLQQWAAFAQPQAASDQVATLLGVRVAVDPGQPVALALNAPVPVAPAAAVPAVALAAAEPVAPVVPVVPVAAEPAAAPAAMAAVVFGPRREVVQSLPVPLLRAADIPARLALARASITPGVQPMRVLRAPSAPVADNARRLGGDAAAVAKVGAPVRATLAPGNWYVQLGAYESAAVARDAWGRFSRRHAGLADRAPQGATIRAGGEAFFRLSVGGFARADADSVCRRLRRQGSACFVRAGAGDQSVRWDGDGRVQLAAR